MMIKKLMGLSIAVLLITELSAIAGFAQTKPAPKPSKINDPTLDLTKLKCRDLLQMDGEDRQLTLVFYHGLMSGKNNQMIVDRSGLAKATDNVINYCIDHPQDTLLSVFEKYAPQSKPVADRRSAP
jgi:hypothetical protein